MKQIVLAAGASLILMGCNHTVDPMEIARAGNDCTSIGMDPTTPAYATCIDLLVVDQEEEWANTESGLYLINAVGGLVGVMISIGVINLDGME